MSNRWKTEGTLVAHGLRGYLAGILDGEGSIVAHISRSGPKDARAKGRRYWGITVQVKMTNKAVIELLQREYGGHIQIIVEKGARAHFRTLYGWRALNRHVVPVLKDTMPWLLIKREQAQAAIRLAELSARVEKGRAGLNNVSAVREKQRLIQRIVELNGRKAPPVFRGDTLYVVESGHIPLS